MLQFIATVYIVLYWIGPWSQIPGFPAVILFLLLITNGIVSYLESWVCNFSIAIKVITILLTGGLSLLSIILLPILWILFISLYLMGLLNWFGVFPAFLFNTTLESDWIHKVLLFLSTIIIIKSWVCVWESKEDF